MNKKERFNTLADSVIQYVGGKDNITDVFHCMTRLRLVLKDQSLINEESITQLNGVLGTGFNAGQFQIIVGNEVDQLYNITADKLGMEKQASIDENLDASSTKGKKSIIELFTSLVSSIFLPITYPIAGCGLVSGIMALATSQQWITNTSDTYLLLSAISDGIFHFLPFVVAFSAARYFKANAFVSAAIIGVMLYPSLSSLVGTDAANLTVLGVVPIGMMNYSYSIIPAIVMVWLQSIMERNIKKIIPRSVDMIITPLLVIFIMSVLTLALIGPAMQFISNLIGDFFTYLFSNMLPVGGLLMGMFYPWLVIAGVHLAFVPIQLDMIARTGVTLILPFMAVANTAQSGAAFGVFLKTKDKELKSLAASAAFSAIIGITEPALYGISVKSKRILYSATLASGIGSLIFVIFKVVAHGLALSPLGALPLFLGETFIPFLIGIAVTFVASTLLTMTFGFKEGEHNG